MDQFNFECKPLKNDITDELDNDKNVVEILAEDIMSVGSDDDDDGNGGLDKAGIEASEEEKIKDSSKETYESRKIKEENQSDNEYKLDDKSREIKEENHSDKEYEPDDDIESVPLDEKDSDWAAEQSSGEKKPKKNKLRKVKKELGSNQSTTKLLKNAKHFKCTKCSEAVRTSREKNVHRKSHNLRYLAFKTTYRCNKCAFETGQSTSFRAHNLTQHSGTDTLFKWKSCPICPFKTITNLALNKHMLNHKVKGAFQCSYCSFSHDHRKNLTVHLRLHDKLLKGLFRCEECSYTATYSSRISVHRKYHHLPEEQKKWKQCDECPFKTVESCNLKRHKRRHKVQEGYRCPKCTYCNLSPFRLKQHIKQHGGEKEPVQDFKPKPAAPLYWCSKCSYSTMTEQRLNRHMTSHTTQNNRKIYCSECPFACKEKIDLITHIKCHNGKGNFKCPKCSFTHWTNAVMAKHKRLHGDEWEQELLRKNRRQGESRCTVCNKLFKSNSLLKRHMKKHQTVDEVESACMCAHCPYRSKGKDVSFVNHIKCHFRTDGIKCEFCTFRHGRPNVMTIHLRLHKETNIKKEPNSS